MLLSYSIKADDGCVDKHIRIGDKIVTYCGFIFYAYTYTAVVVLLRTYIHTPNACVPIPTRRPDLESDHVPQRGKGVVSVVSVIVTLCRDVQV